MPSLPYLVWSALPFIVGKPTMKAGIFRSAGLIKPACALQDMFLLQRTGSVEQILLPYPAAPDKATAFEVLILCESKAVVVSKATLLTTDYLVVAGMQRSAWAGSSHMSGTWPGKTLRRPVERLLRRYRRIALWLPPENCSCRRPTCTGSSGCETQRCNQSSRRSCIK